MPRRDKNVIHVDEIALGGTKPPVGVTVGQLFADMDELLKLSSVEENDGLNRPVRGTEINRPGLALAGYFAHFSNKQIQVLGMTELAYLTSLEEERRSAIFQKICAYDEVPCFFVARGRRPPPAMIAAARWARIPVAVSRRRTTDVVALVSDYLRDKFAPSVAFHGDLLDVYGVGILILGGAAVGKSECALDLLARGHRIVADDVVYARRRITGELVGDTKDVLREHIEIRGLGILNVRQLFGIRAVRQSKRIELIVNIQLFDAATEYNRTGLDHLTANILGVELPFLTIPVVPGKNISSLIEVAALNYLLKHNHGYDAALLFDEKIRARIAGGSAEGKKA